MLYEVITNITVTVFPKPSFSLGISGVAAPDNRVCEGDPITIYANPGSVAGMTYTLSYVSGAYAVAPADLDNLTGEFIIYPEPGQHTYQLTATNSYGCSFSQNVTVKVFDVPNITIAPSCYDRSITMTGTMLGTNTSPLNFTGSDIGHVEYSYNDGVSWTTETYHGPDLSLGPVTVYARNSAYPNCETSIVGEISYVSVYAEDVEICQGEPSVALDALSLCVDWGKTPHVTDLDPDDTQTYIVSSTEDHYTPGAVVAYTTT